MPETQVIQIALATFVLGFLGGLFSLKLLKLFFNWLWRLTARFRYFRKLN